MCDNPLFDTQIYDSSSDSDEEPNVNKVRIKANKNSEKIDGNDLADTLSIGLQNLENILSRRQSITCTEGIFLMDKYWPI